MQFLILEIDFAIEMFTDALTGKLDATNLGDVLRVCGLNPSLDALEKLGATKKPGNCLFQDVIYDVIWNSDNLK